MKHIFKPLITRKNFEKFCKHYDVKPENYEDTFFIINESPATELKVDIEEIERRLNFSWRHMKKDKK